MVESLMKVTARQTGWIGVDVGTSHVKVVQLTGGRRLPCLAATAIVPRLKAWNIEEMTEDSALSSSGELIAAANLRPDFRGRRVAAALPMSLCQFHQFDRSLSMGSHRDRAVRHALEAANQGPITRMQYAAWPAELDAEGTGPVRTNVLAVPHAWSDQLCEDLAQTGWSCQAIDGLPWALARAVKMVLNEDQQAPWAALDWGYTQATFCVIAEGRPVYVRGLKDCSLRQLFNLITEELLVSEDEALRLLQEYGLAGHEPLEVSRVVEELLAEPLDRLQQELTRTLSHLKGQRRSIVPQGAYLFGGGATIRGLAEHLADKLELELRLWQLDKADSTSDSRSGPPACMFGPAAALSALAWEGK